MIVLILFVIQPAGLVRMRTRDYALPAGRVQALPQRTREARCRGWSRSCPSACGPERIFIRLICLLH